MENQVVAGQYYKSSSFETIYEVIKVENYGLSLRGVNDRHEFWTQIGYLSGMTLLTDYKPPPKPEFKVGELYRNKFSKQFIQITEIMNYTYGRIHYKFMNIGINGANSCSEETFAQTYELVKTEDVNLIAKLPETLPDGIENPVGKFYYSKYQEENLIEVLEVYQQGSAFWIEARHLYNNIYRHTTTYSSTFSHFQDNYRLSTDDLEKIKDKFLSKFEIKYFKKPPNHWAIHMGDGNFVYFKKKKFAETVSEALKKVGHKFYTYGTAYSD